MKNNKKRVIFTITDYVINIFVFDDVECEKNILYTQQKVFDHKIMKSGFICDQVAIKDAIKELKKNAELFISKKITNAYIGIDTTSIKKNKYDTDIQLKDQIITKDIKNRINLEINEAYFKHVYDLKYDSWTIDGVKYDDIDSVPIAGDKLKLTIITYEINSSLYDYVSQTFNDCGISVINVRPLINSLCSLAQDASNKNNELFIYVNYESINIAQSSGKWLDKTIKENTFGLDNLYKQIAINNNVSEKEIKEILENTNILYDKNNDITFTKGYKLDYNSLKLSKQSILQIINKFAEGLSKLIDQSITKLKVEKNVSLSRVRFIPTNDLTRFIFNTTQIYNGGRYEIYDVMDTDIELSDDINGYLLMDELINNEYKDETSVNYFDNLSAKDIKILKGEYDG